MLVYSRSVLVSVNKLIPGILADAVSRVISAFVIVLVSVNRVSQQQSTELTSG